MPNVRYRAPDFEALTRDLQVTVQRERALRSAAGHDGPLPAISFLALSGGGADGAFGAGLLVGWSQRGDRPEFNIVTGMRWPTTGHCSAWWKPTSRSRRWTLSRPNR